MKYLLYILLAAPFIFSCKGFLKRHAGDSNYFEGAVEFSITYDGPDSALLRWLKYYMGDKLVTYINKNGFISREYVDSIGAVRMQEIFRPDSLELYTLAANRDTIDGVDASVSAYGTFIGVSKNTNVKILGDAVEKLRVRGLFRMAGENKDMYIYSTYYNDINYPLSPSAYEGVEYNKTAAAFAQSPYVTVKYVIEYGERLTMTFTAGKISAGHVADIHFNLPENKVIVEKLKKN